MSHLHLICIFYPAETKSCTWNMKTLVNFTDVFIIDVSSSGAASSLNAVAFIC